MMDKQALREQSLKRREGISIIEIAELSARVSMNALKMPAYRQAKRVFCYWGVHSEVATHGLIRQMIAGGREVYLPVMRAQRQLAAVKYRDRSQLAPGRFGILEPTDGEEIDPALLDVLFVPGLAFDRRGGRLGSGGGYMDRFLPRTKGVKVALAYEMQLLDGVPMDALDVKMDYIATEFRVYDCGLEG